MKHYSFNWGECSNYTPRPLKEGRVFCQSCKAVIHPVCYACGWEGGHVPNDLNCLNNKVRTLTEELSKKRLEAEQNFAMMNYWKKQYYTLRDSVSACL